MTTAAAVTGTQVYQMYINASQQKVWEAITTPEIVAAYFRGAQVQGSYQPGKTDDGTCLVGISKWESRQAFFASGLTLRPPDEIVEGETRPRQRLFLEEVASGLSR
jgi:uncharacterized protein YndB with AHSA1/START domain